MEHERFDPELDDLLDDIHRLIDENDALADLPQEQDLVGDFDFAGLFDEVTTSAEDGASAVGFDADFEAEFGAALAAEPDMELEADLDFETLLQEPEETEPVPQPEPEPAAEPEPVPEPAPEPAAEPEEGA